MVGGHMRGHPDNSMDLSRMMGAGCRNMIDAQEQLNCRERGNQALKIVENGAISGLVRDVARREPRPA